VKETIKIYLFKNRLRDFTTHRSLSKRHRRKEKLEVWMGSTDSKNLPMMACTMGYEQR
jgi:hypothetical protein